MPDSDLDALREDFIGITPMDADMTAHGRVGLLRLLRFGVGP